MCMYSCTNIAVCYLSAGKEATNERRAWLVSFLRPQSAQAEDDLKTAGKPVHKPVHSVRDVEEGGGGRVVVAVLALVEVGLHARQEVRVRGRLAGKWGSAPESA